MTADTTTLEEVATKRCPRCEQELPVDSFALSAKNRRQTCCRGCNTTYAREWIAKNRDKTAANKLWSLYRMRPADLLPDPACRGRGQRVDQPQPVPA